MIFLDHKLELIEHNISGVMDCNCLPGCTTLMYDTETSQGQIDYPLTGLPKK